jgi:hypothetical protein
MLEDPGDHDSDDTELHDCSCKRTHQIELLLDSEAPHYAGSKRAQHNGGARRLER